MANNSSLVPRTWLVKLLNAGRRVLGWLGSGWVRLLLVIVALGVLGFCMYTNIWQPLIEPVSLPRGVTPTNPALDVTILKDINTQRAERVQGPPPSFDFYNKSFVVSRPP